MSVNLLLYVRQKLFCARKQGWSYVSLRSVCDMMWVVDLCVEATVQVETNGTARTTSDGLQWKQKQSKHTERLV